MLMFVCNSNDVTYAMTLIISYCIVGFPVVALLFIISTIPISSYLLDNVEKEKEKSAWSACWTSTVAFVALAIHGVVPLHEDVLNMLNGRPSTGDGTLNR